jgi:hypothetical protein
VLWRNAKWWRRRRRWWYIMEMLINNFQFLDRRFNNNGRILHIYYWFLCRLYNHYKY